MASEKTPVRGTWTVAADGTVIKVRDGASSTPAPLGTDKLYTGQYL